MFVCLKRCSSFSSMMARIHLIMILLNDAFISGNFTTKNIEKIHLNNICTNNSCHAINWLIEAMMSGVKK